VKRAAHFHAREDAVNPVLIPPLHPLQKRPNMVLHVHAFSPFLHRHLVVAGVAFYPSPVFQGAFRQDLRRDGILAVHVAEEMDDVFGTGQQRQVSLDDDAVETVIYKYQEACKGFAKVSIGRLLKRFGWIPKSSVRATGGINRT